MHQQISIPPGDKIIQTGDIQTLSEIIDWGLIDIDVPKLWATKNRGDNVKVMVCDTGISDHEDLKDNILWRWARSFVKGENVIDYNSHGTSVAGVIAAKDSGFGIIGVAPDSKIIPVKVLSNAGFGTMLSTIKAFIYASRIKPDVINMSLGMRSRYNKRFENLLKKLFGLKIPIVCAMGNYGTRYGCYPAMYAETIGVTSYKKDKNISDFSSRSNMADYALPGEDILTTTLDNKYSIVSGTSFSAPFLTGLISIIISEGKKKNITYSINQLKRILTKSCTDYGAIGKDNEFGNGIININKLIF